MYKLSCVALLAVLFASCENSGLRQQAEPVPSVPATTVAPTPPAAGASQPAVTPGTPATNSAATANLNPAHGAPGHSCDVPVGAPLNGSPGNAPAGSLPAPVQLQPPAFPPQPVKGNARLNPPHGQPGHDCSVQVGQPLKN